ncbi:MAG: hypothetical protein KKA07_14570 [Bacteroidetes bacterium]|nr:hypothetical protein [Bacteroidota bacterium]MBU1720285.1 hypothetical protein [Bacteroidota bacterium]
MEAPRIPSMVRLPKHKRFRYKPRYYDPDEEERKERYARYKKEYGLGADESNSTEAKLPPPAFKEAWQSRKNTAPVQRFSALRIATIAVALSLLAYYILKS